MRPHSRRASLIVLASALVMGFLFFRFMLSRFLGVSHQLSSVAATVLGFVVLTFLIVTLVHHARILLALGPCQTRISTSIVILIGFTLLFAAATAVGRMVLGLTASQSSRYVTLLIPGFLGLYLHLLTVRSLLLQSVSLAVMATLLLPWPLTESDMGSAAGFASAKRAWKECYVKTKDLTRCGTTLLIHPTPGALSERLAYLKTHRLNLYAR